MIYSSKKLASFYGVLVLLAFVIIGFDALGQAAGAEKGTPGLNAAMPKLFGKNSNFIARVEAHVYDKNHRETTAMPMGFEMLGNRIRVDINMTQVKSREMSPEFAAQMKQMGMDQMTTILLPDKKTVYTIYPGLKAYAETPLDKQEAEAANQKFKVDKKLLGKEAVDGHRCEKYAVTLTDEKGAQQNATTWEATDLNNFPVQMQLTEDHASVMMNYKDIKLGRPSESHFQPPTGMAKFDSVNALMSDAITKKMNSGAAK